METPAANVESLYESLINDRKLELEVVVMSQPSRILVAKNLRDVKLSISYLGVVRNQESIQGFRASVLAIIPSFESCFEN